MDKVWYIYTAELYSIINNKTAYRHSGDIFCCAGKTLTKNNLKKKGFISVYRLDTIKRTPKRNSSLNQKAETKAESMEECCFHWRGPQAYSVSFPVYSRTTCPGVVPPTVGGALLNQQSRQCPTGLPVANLLEAFP